MNKKIFLDIETVPPDESFREQILSEMRKENADCTSQTDADQMEATIEKRYRNLALQGEFGRVLAIGLVIESNGKVEHRGVLGRDRNTRRFHLDESRTLRSFWKLLQDFDPRRDLIIGHNVFDFDLLFLYKRSVIHRVRPSVEMSFARYRSQPIFDTMREWERWGRKCISLDHLACALGLESSKSKGIDGSCVYDYFIEGKHEEIAEY
jgi:3'-5' exonuclease